MFPAFLSIKSGLLNLLPRHFAILPVLVLLFETGAPGAADTGTGPNLLPSGDFESGTPGYNPWGGVDNSGYLHVWTGSQLATDDAGKIDGQAFSPSIAVGDLNGDGLPDLVVADPRGYFWFFANSGKPEAPAFTHGEVMPIWLGEWWMDGDVVPRIQLIDYTGENKLSLVAGDFAGRLYFIHNRGSATEPDFHMPQDRGSLSVPTHSEDLLWCNYPSPFLYDWSGTGRLDLLMGDGSYSANSIYLFANQSGNSRPVFKEKQRIKIIPGMGREHLTPQVVDWNNDGRPDVISGERTGYINVYLNQNKDNSYPPTFDKDHPIHVNFGGADKFGAFSTVCVADLNNDKLFDLVLGNPDGRIYYALNTGTPGSPKFGTPIPFKGVYPYANVPPFAKVLLPETWYIVRTWPYGAPGELLQCTNATIEPGFTPPPDFKGKGAMRFSVGLPPAKYFKEMYYPEGDDDSTKRAIRSSQGVSIQTDTRYILSFWVRAEGTISNLTWRIYAAQDVAKAGDWTLTTTNGDPIEVGSTWNRISTTVKIRCLTGKRPPDTTNNSEFTLLWEGDGTVYFDDITLKKAQ